MVKPPEFDDIISQPLTDAEKDTFLAEQYWFRSLERSVQDLFSEVK